MSNKRSAVKPNVYENVAEKLRGSITLEKKIGVIRRMEDRQTHPSMYGNTDMPAVTESVMQVSCRRSKLLENMGTLLSLWATLTAWSRVHLEKLTGS